MSDAICNNCGCPTPEIVEIPGSPGSAGTDGANGINAFDLVQTEFVVPAIGGSVSVIGAQNSWAAVDQILFIEAAGFFQLTGKAGTTVYTLTYLNVTENTHATETIAIGSEISPAGARGAVGAININGTGSPVGVVTPDAVDQFYRRTDVQELYQSTGVTSADWLQWV